MKEPIITSFNVFRYTTTILYKKDEFLNKPLASVTFVPYVVNGCFCIEIGLKAIAKENKITYKKGHSLIDLFELLPEHE